jgi:hypothetical protein
VIEDRILQVGTRLVANYKKQTYVCTVESAEEGEGIVFALQDGKKFKSPSVAASAVMGGQAANGWRFWSVEGAEPRPASAKTEPKIRAARGKKASSKTTAKSRRNGRKTHSVIQSASTKRTWAKARCATGATPAWRASSASRVRRRSSAPKATATTIPS